MNGNIKYARKSVAPLLCLMACLCALAFLSSSCAGGSNAGGAGGIEPEVDILEVTPEPTPDPDVTPSPEPTPTPWILEDMSANPEPPQPQFDPIASGEEIAVLETSLGEMRVRFFPEYAPKAVQNFKTLAKSGYFDGVKFFEVVEDAALFTGDPTGTGALGDSIWGQPFEPETSISMHHFKGAVSMILSDYGQGTQFFIVSNKELEDAAKEEMASLKEKQNHVAATSSDGSPIALAQLFPVKVIDKYLKEGGMPSLDTNYTLFAQVYEGLDTIDKLASVETSKEEGEENKPLTDIVITKVTFEKYNA